MSDYESRIWDALEEEAKGSPRILTSRHAAALVYRKGVICVGTNKRKSHPIMQKFSHNPEKIYLHAEIDCIVRAINLFGVEILSRCDLYVLRLDRRNRRAMSKPCECCNRAIQAFGIRNVKWTT
jgi:tRNA(Arg) A34 adenosine deaminase TadA